MNAAAVVLTYRRPRLVTRVVRALVEDEGLPESQIVLVINGDGGLDDPALEQRINVLRLPENLGPAGGFRAGLEHARAAYATDWFYLCEDDDSALSMPRGGLAELIEDLERWSNDHRETSIGAVGVRGWDLDHRTGVARQRAIAGVTRFESVDMTEWGGTLLASRVLEAGLLPDPDWFWGSEDLDFFLRLRAAGFETFLDTQRAIPEIAGPQKQRALQAERPTNADEPWCNYYFTRNSLEMARRHGHLGWTLWQLLKSARRLQLGPTMRHRKAVVRGLADGLKGRMGKNPVFTREVGEW